MTVMCPKARWYRVTPISAVFLLLGIQGLLWLSEQCSWFDINHCKGCTVLIAVGSIAVAIPLMLLWLLGAFVFRWQFQFSVRFLLALIAVVAIPFSWLAVEMWQAREQREAVEAVEKLRGHVTYDYEPPYGLHSMTRPEPMGSLWLRKILGKDLLGKDMFANVTGVDLTRSSVVDTDLRYLKRFTQLENLNLDETAISNVGLKQIEGFTRIHALGLGSTKVSDVGLERLKRLTQLRALNLSDTNVTDVGLRHLQELTQLQNLYLNDTKISDVGLEYLMQLPQLQELFLCGTKISDAGLQHLRGLPQLQFLFLWGTNVTDAGVVRFQQALPNCRIRHRWHSP